jgi:hypothetical protein
MSARIVTLITDRDESLRAFQSFRDAFAAGADLYQDHSIGWQGGSVRIDVHWHEAAGIWGVFERQPPREEKGAHRFWNCFGVAAPSKNSMLSITVEINPPHQGEDRRTAGLFLHDESGRRYVGHSGKVGGGRPGIGQRAFREFSRDLGWQEIVTPSGFREILVFGPLQIQELPLVLVRFVRMVADFKESVAVPR